jgi:hypothetical protein
MRREIRENVLSPRYPALRGVATPRYAAQSGVATTRCVA